VSIFNKRNALVGFLTLKWLETRRRRKRRNALKYAAVGLASLGLIAALGAVIVKRRSEDEPSEGYAFGVEDDEIVGEVVTSSSEPYPAT
jgi:hypothetical protein